MVGVQPFAVADQDVLRPRSLWCTRSPCQHRRCERPAHKRSKPRALVATQPDKVHCWDITYLPTQVRGTFFYLYLFVDLFSRKVVGWQSRASTRL
jgi:transposase InsO family protein